MGDTFFFGCGYLMPKYIKKNFNKLPDRKSLKALGSQALFISMARGLPVFKVYLLMKKILLVDGNKDILCLVEGFAPTNKS